MAKSLTVKNVIEQAELIFGRQSEAYMMRLINDALLDIGEKKQHYVVSAKQNFQRELFETIDSMYFIFRNVSNLLISVLQLNYVAIFLTLRLIFLNIRII